MTGTTYVDEITQAAPVQLEFYTDTTFVKSVTVDHPTYGLYYLSPGCKVTRTFGKENISPQIPLIGSLLVDPGLTNMDQLVVSGELTYKHNTKDPIRVLDEITYLAKTHKSPVTASTDPLNVDATNGAILLRVGLTTLPNGNPVGNMDTDLINMAPAGYHYCTLERLTYDYDVGAKPPTYTITLNLITKGSS